MKPKIKIRSWVFAFTAAAVFFGAFFLKLGIFDRGCNLKAGEFGLFRVEEATRYRYAELASEGKKIPEIDRRIQYPEGLNVKKHFTTLSQRVIGGSYRILRLKMPFHVYVIYFMFLYSSLSVLALYKIAFLLSGSGAFSLIAVLFYATNFASSSRTIAGGLVEEDFALPLMFFALFFILKTLKSRRKIYPVSAGILLALALSSWHVSQFFYLILLSILAALYVFKPEERDKIFTAVFPVLIIQTAAGIFVPVLRGGFFLLSFSQLLGYSFCIAHFAGKKLPVFLRNRVGVIFLFVFSFCLFFAASRTLVKQHAKNYAHVYSLMFNKVKYLGNKPTFDKEVKTLPFDAKVLWQSSFVSPDFKFVKDIFLIVFLFSLPGLFAAGRKLFKTGDSPLLIIFLLLISFFLLFLLIKRLYVFVIFFLCLFVPLVKHLSKKNFFRVFSAVVLLFGIYIQSRQTLPKLNAVPRRINSYKQEILKWMNKNIPPGSVILCNIGFAPEIVQNSGFSTVLHNHYEAKDIRDKTKEFYENIYEDEETFYRFAKKYGSQYLLYHWDILIDKSINSVRYQVDRMNIFKNAACFKFHFDYEKLKRFELIYQNEYYRLFRILDNGQKPQRHAVRYIPFFNKRIFIPSKKIIFMEGQKDRGEVFDDEFAKNKMDGVWSLPKLKNTADGLAEKGDLAGAERTYLEMLEIDPFYMRTRIILADFYIRSGNPGKAIPHLEWTVKNYTEPENYIFIISALEIAGDKSSAEKYRREARGLFPQDTRFR
ncbi:MAG: hypothetical protein ABIJ15_04865 [bacterium]